MTEHTKASIRPPGGITSQRNRISRRVVAVFLSLLLSLSIFISTPSPSLAQTANFTPAPETDYAKQFIQSCEGQTWFINEIERLLNQQEKTLNKITSQSDLNDIYALGFAGAGTITKIPQAIGELKNLKHLFLSNNRISAIPPEIYSLTNLETLDLANNRIAEPLSPQLANLTKLEVLSLWGNSITGTIIPAITQMPALVNVDISYNNLTGTLPAELANLPKLIFFAASNNQLSGTLPPALSGSPNLKALILWNNNFSGSIPASYGSFLQLTLLDLAGNDLTGTIPSSLGTLSTLKELSLRANQLTGTIPSSLSNLTNLEILDLHSNTLSGGIPSGLSSLINMKKLDLSDNQFTGTLPDIFAAMPHLSWVHLEKNRLTGLAPDSLFTAQKNGCDVDLRSNYMTGDTLKQITKNADNFVDFASGMQNYLYLPPYIKVPVDTQINAYDMLTHRDSQTNLTNAAKAKLPLSAYTCTIISTDPDVLDYISLDITAQGFIIKVLQEIKLADAIEFEIRITDNTGSVYSSTRFKVTTDTPPVIPDPIPTPAPATPTPAPGTNPGGIGGPGPLATIPPQRLPEDERLETLIDTSKVHAEHYHANYFSGYPDKTFRPESLITREEALFVVYNITNKSDKAQVFPDAGYTDTDSNPAYWAGPAVRYLSAKQVLAIFEPDVLRPTRPITRGEFIAIVMRSLNQSVTTDKTLSDIAGHPYEAYIRSAIALGFIAGYPDGSFKPDQSIARAEVTVILNALLGRSVQRGDFERVINPFTDITPDYWAYEHIMEASCPHYVMRDSEGNEYRRFTK